MVCQYVELMFWLKMPKDLLSFRNVWLRLPLILTQDSLKLRQSLSSQTLLNYKTE